MLSEMNQRLIAKEETRFNHIDKLIPLLDPSCPVKNIEELFENYHIQETTQHWYDSSPNECDTCNKHYSKCNKCQLWKEWEGSEKQLSLNNWIDVYGPGIWGMSQEESDEQARDILNKAISKEENMERLFFCVPQIINKKEYFDIFYYNRDREHSDWWFVFRRAPGRD